MRIRSKVKRIDITEDAYNKLSSIRSAHNTTYSAIIDELIRGYGVKLHKHKAQSETYIPVGYLGLSEARLNFYRGIHARRSTIGMMEQTCIN